MERGRHRERLLSVADGRGTSQCPTIPTVRYQDQEKSESLPSAKTVTKRSVQIKTKKKKTARYVPSDGLL